MRPEKRLSLSGYKIQFKSWSSSTRTHFDEHTAHLIWWSLEGNVFKCHVIAVVNEFLIQDWRRNFSRRSLALFVHFIPLLANNTCFIFAVQQRYVLTAAHCVAPDSDHENGNAFYILVGDHDITTGSDTKYSQLYYVEEVRRHQQFDQAGFEHDIALLRTTDDIVWSRAVGPACLPFSFLYVLTKLCLSTSSIYF